MRIINMIGQDCSIIWNYLHSKDVVLLSYERWPFLFQWKGSVSLRICEFLTVFSLELHTKPTTRGKTTNKRKWDTDIHQTLHGERKYVNILCINILQHLKKACNFYRELAQSVVATVNLWVCLLYNLLFFFEA